MKVFLIMFLMIALCITGLYAGPGCGSAGCSTAATAKTEVKTEVKAPVKDSDAKCSEDCAKEDCPECIEKGCEEGCDCGDCQDGDAECGDDCAKGDCPKCVEKSCEEGCECKDCQDKDDCKDCDEHSDKVKDNDGCSCGKDDCDSCPDADRKEKTMWDMLKGSNQEEILEQLNDKEKSATINVERAKQAFENDWPILRIATEKGDIIVALFEDDVPNTVNSFLYLTGNKYYDGLTFHRVVNDFVIQGGDPTGSGMGGPGYNIKLEISKWKHEKGMLSMARSADPDSNGSQFFVTHRATPHLDNKYSAFGWVLEGQNVVDLIAVGDKMTKVEILKKRDHEYKPEIVRGELPF